MGLKVNCYIYLVKYAQNGKLFQLKALHLNVLYILCHIHRL